jgi:hypothetical protein
MIRTTILMLGLLAAGTVMAQIDPNGAQFQDVMGDDYYELPADASDADRLQYSRAITRGLLTYISTAYNNKKRALDDSWANGELDSPAREAALAELNETNSTLRNQIHGSGYEDMVVDELLVFARQTMGATESSFGSGGTEFQSGASKRSPLADALENCSRLEERFTHELNGEQMSREIQPAASGCHYSETMPGNFRMNCVWKTRTELSEMADYFRNAEYYATAKVSSTTEFVGSQPVTTTSYVLDGKPWRNPMQTSIDTGQCKVTRQ